VKQDRSTVLETQHHHQQAQALPDLWQARSAVQEQVQVMVQMRQTRSAVLELQHHHHHQSQAPPDLWQARSIALAIALVKQDRLTALKQLQQLRRP